MFISKTHEAAGDIPKRGTNETTILGAVNTTLCSVNESPSTEKELNESIKQLRLLKQKCTDLEKKVSDLEDKCQALQSNVFSLSRFTSDEAMSFYTGYEIKLRCCKTVLPLKLPPFRM